jgi:hypothetical protein
MINHTNLWLALKRHYWNPPNLWEFEFPPAKYLPKGHPNRVKWGQSQVRQTILMHDFIYDLKSFSGTFITLPDPPNPKIGDTITIGNMKYRVTKILNKRKSHEFEYVIKKILERQNDKTT